MNKPIIRLSLLDSFSCWGGECPDDCCHGWNIHLDRETREKWCKLDDRQLSQELLSSVAVINDEGRPTEIIKQTETHECIHLNQQGLCRIQLSLGHACLPQTCQDYPRARVESEKRILYSAHLSCPSLLRQLVLLEDGAELFIRETTAEAPLPPEGGAALNIQMVATRLEEMTAQLMAENRFPLSSRLYYLAMVLSNLASLAGKDALDEKSLRKVCKTTSAGLQKQLNDISKAVTNRRVKVNKMSAGRFWKYVFTSCRALQEESFAAKFTASPLVSMLKETSASNDEHSSIKVYNGIASLRREVAGKHGSLLEKLLHRYLMVKFVNHGFPWYPFNNNFNATFLDCLVPFFQINLLIWCRYQQAGRINQEEIETIIYKVEKKLAHNTLILQTLNKEPWLLEMEKYSAGWLDLP